MKKVRILVAAIAVTALMIPPIHFTAAQATLANPGFEQGNAQSSATSWQPYGNGYTRSTTKRSGAWSLKLHNQSKTSISGASQRIDLNQTELQPVFIGGFVSGKKIVNAPGGYFGASLYAEIHLRDGSIAYWNSIANLGTFAWRWIGFNTGSLSSVNQPIDYIYVVPILANAKGSAYFDDVTVSEYAPRQSALTIMFDDGESSTINDGKPVLDQYGFVASAAVISDMVGEEGFMDASDLTALENSGWEIVSHSVSHEDLTTMKDGAVKKELADSQAGLEEHGLTVNNFAMPFGAYNGFVLGEAAKLYGSARAYEQGDNPQGTFPFDVKVHGVLNTTTPAEVSSWIQQARDNNRWIVLNFHSIAESGEDAYYIPSNIFQQMIAAVAASGINVVTYDQGLKLFGVSR